MSKHTEAILDVHDDRANIVLRTEAGLNVASLEFLQALEQVLDRLHASPSVRFVVITGQGKAFLAGANIKAMVDYDPQAARRMAEIGHRVFNKLEVLPAITAASIQGICLGGGCELALACDFRFAVKSVNIGQPEVLLGLIPGWGGTQRLPQLVGLSNARRLILSGQSIKGEEARGIGLVDEIVNSAEDLDPYVTAFLRKLRAAGPHAVALAKQALRGKPEVDMFTQCFDGDHAATGMKAFLSKQPAPWASDHS